jgi:hypothetical protein
VSTNLRAVTYGNGLFVAVGDSGVVITSSDGITWTSRTSGVNNILYGITYGNGLFVAVGNSGVVITSPLFDFGKYNPGVNLYDFAGFTYQLQD